MARSKSKFTIDSEYALVRVLCAVLRGLPDSWAQSILLGILKIVLIFIPKRRKLMLENIAKSFPELSHTEHRRIAHKSLNNLARGTIVLLHMPEILLKPGDPDWVDVEGLEILERARAKGKGVVTFTGHYGCWELMAALTMKNYPNVSAVYRALDNPRIDAFVKHLRSSAGGTMIERRNVLKECLRLLKTNALIGFLVDQNFAAGGVFVDFFGRLAATTPILSVLARRTGATVLYTRNRWEGKRLKITWGETPPLSTNPDTEMAIAEDTLAMTKIVESWIREDPGQWMWLHNRWKRQPMEGEKVYRFGGAGGI